MILRSEAAPLTPAEQQELAEQERRIAQGLKTFQEVGQALAKVRDQRLYRDEYHSFDEYCRKRWGLGRQYAYRVIDGAAVMQDLSPIGDTVLPANEAQVRPLTRLKDPEERRQVWRAVLAAAPETPITAGLVRRVVRERLALPAAPPAAPAAPRTVQEAEASILTLARQYARASGEEKRALSQRLLATTRYLVRLEKLSVVDQEDE